MTDFFTFAIYDNGDGLKMSGIPSLEVARSIVSDFYRQPAKWDSFIEELTPKQDVIFDFEDERLMFGYSIDRFFGSIAIERRCGCCGHVIERSTLTAADSATALTMNSAKMSRRLPCNCRDVPGLDENRHLQHCNDRNELHRLRAIVSGKTFSGETPIVVEEERDQLRAALKRVREVLSQWSSGLSRAHEYGCGNNRPCDACEIDELLTKLAR